MRWLSDLYRHFWMIALYDEDLVAHIRFFLGLSTHFLELVFTQSFVRVLSVDTHTLSQPEYTRALLRIIASKPRWLLICPLSW